MSPRALLFVVGVAAATTACGGAAPTRVRVADADRAAAAAKGHPAETLAPQLFAAGELERKAAHEAATRGDGVHADLHAERAIAAYAHAAVLARLALATDDLAHAAADRDRLEDLAQKHAAMRASAQREVEDLERQLKIAREVELPAPSGRADPEREKARWAAAESLLEEAHLLCGAARLVSDAAPGLAEADAALADLEKRRAARTAKTSAPIDETARARAACLSSLTRARRPTASRIQDESDALLAELSNAAASTKSSSPSPSRDERGVVVVLPAATSFHDDALTSEAKDVLADLGRVASAHPHFALQVVVHDDVARPAASGDARARAVADALTAAGATKDRIRTENAGTRVRIVDPSSKDHARNARVEVVFVPLGAS